MFAMVLLCRLRLSRTSPVSTRFARHGKVRKTRYEVIEVPYYPTIEDRKWASDCLAERGWGKPKQAHEVTMDEDGGPRAFQILYRRWPVGVDPRAQAERVIDGQGRALPPASPNGDEGR